jgi:hypothetical protein
MALHLSETECAEIVTKASAREDVKIIKFNVESFGNFFGFLGEYFRLKVEANVGATENVGGNWDLPERSETLRKSAVEVG